MAYQQKIAERISFLSHVGSAVDRDAVGTEANLRCGSVLRFSLSMEPSSKSVLDARFMSNGCGYMLAAAEVLAENVINRRLADLHGLNVAELELSVSKILGEIPAERHECIVACIHALRSAFADHRARRIEEFRGEKALICTCFGITEEAIEAHIEIGALTSVADVTDECNAGGGCGSCRMLIQEMLDAKARAG